MHSNMFRVFFSVNHSKMAHIESIIFKRYHFVDDVYTQFGTICNNYSTFIFSDWPIYAKLTRTQGHAVLLRVCHLIINSS